VTFHWSGAANASLLWTTSVRAYAASGMQAGVLAFSQEWPNGASNISTADQKVSAGWPFIAPSANLGYMEFSGASAGWMTHAGDTFPHGVSGGKFAGAVALLPADPAERHVLVMSQLTNFFGGGFDPVNRTARSGIALGVRGTFESLSAGFRSEAFMVLQEGGGLRGALRSWGTCQCSCSSNSGACHCLCLRC